MNQLTQEISPYLLAHANNPVDWYPWSETALLRAKKEAKPIFLSIGYSACHWCHVMEQESFMNQGVANFLNANFVSIKVDREERPDIDKIYMDALVSMTGSGGWPMSVFLTPDLTPFYAGTYFPPQTRYGMPAFLQVLQSVVRAWNDNPNQLFEYGLQIRKHLQKTVESQNTEAEPIQNILGKSVQTIFDQIDPNYGGWGSKPKFAHPLTLLFLLDEYIDLTSTQQKQVESTLNAMVAGGFYDLLRGGFHRYSTDEKWLVPHFEKMLYDNALLTQLYLNAGSIFKNHDYLKVAEETLNFMRSELLSPAGGFWSSLDADSEGEEGLFYTWRYDELRILFSEKEWEKLNQSFEISTHGNFEGQIILRKIDNQLPQDILEKLKAVQDQRIRPATDDKILVDWNGMAISAFANASRILANQNYLSVAINAANFILSEMMVDQHLFHAYREGQVRSQAFLSDYSLLVNALIDLYMVTMNEYWLNQAISLCDKMVSIFWDGNQFFDSRDDDPTLITRPQTLEDSVVPAGWSAAIFAMQRLNVFREVKKYEQIVTTSHKHILGIINQAPLSTSFWLKTLPRVINADDYIVLVKRTSDPARSNSLENFITKHKHPETPFIIVNETEIGKTTIPILKDKKCQANQTTVYVCFKNKCSAPVTSIDSLKKELV